MPEPFDDSTGINQTLPSDIVIFPGIFPGYMSEVELINNIDVQFSDCRDYSVRKDYLYLYFIHFLKMSPDIDMRDVESFINFDEQDPTAKSFKFIMEEMKRFFYNFGIDVYSLEDDCDFEVIYELYNLFILELPKTLAIYMLGLKNPKNEFFGDPTMYDPENFDNNITFAQSLENLDNKQIEEINKIVKNEPKIEKILSNPTNSLVFKNILIKIFFDENYSFDDFFKIMLLVDEDNEIYEKYDNLITEGRVNFTHELLLKNIRNFVSFSENSDELENRYREIEMMNKFKPSDIIK